MMENIPILGGQKAQAGTGIQSLARRLDANGLFTVDVVLDTATGQPIAKPARDSYVSAEELCEMIRQVVREELEFRDDRARRAD